MVSCPLCQYSLPPIAQATPLLFRQPSSNSTRGRWQSSVWRPWTWGICCSFSIQVSNSNQQKASITIRTLGTSSMFCLSCSSQKLKNHDSGKQIYTTSPAWTLKGRLEEMQQKRSPGPVYDASRGYKYLEQVRLYASQKHAIIASSAARNSTMAVSKSMPNQLLPYGHASSCAQLVLVCLTAWSDLKDRGNICKNTENTLCQLYCNVTYTASQQNEL